MRDWPTRLFSSGKSRTFSIFCQVNFLTRVRSLRGWLHFHEEEERVTLKPRSIHFACLYPPAFCCIDYKERQKRFEFSVTLALLCVNYLIELSNKKRQKALYRK